MTQPVTSYSKDKLSKASVVAYQWCRRENYKYSIYLCADILRDICTEKRRYRNRINNRKHPKGSLRPGRPRKEKNKHAPKSACVPRPAGPGAPEAAVGASGSSGKRPAGTSGMLSSARH